MCDSNLGEIFSAIAAAAGIFTVGHLIIQKMKADLSIIVLSRGGAWENVAIKNTGEADAKNITVTFPKSLNIKFDNEALMAAKLSKGQQYNISIGPVHSEKNIPCNLEWDDKMGHHKKTQNIQIL